MESDYQHGDIVWAKMKGYPPWPATILQNSQNSEGIPMGRYSVMFFGTRETAIIKHNDLLDYEKHRKDYDIPGKKRGFNEALKEARLAFELAECTKLGEQKRRRKTVQVLASSTTVDCHKRSKKKRRSAPVKPKIEDQKSIGAIDGVVKVVQIPDVFETISDEKPEENIDTKFEEKLKDDIVNSAQHRRKMNSFSQVFDMDCSDDPMLPMIGDLFLSAQNDGLGVDTDESPKSPTKNFRRSRNIFDEYTSAGRLRFNSTSSSERTRLPSGFSDMIDELLNSNPAVFNSSEFLPLHDPLFPYDEGEHCSVEHSASFHDPVHDGEPSTSWCPSCGSTFSNNDIKCACKFGEKMDYCSESNLVATDVNMSSMMNMGTERNEPYISVPCNIINESDFAPSTSNIASVKSEYAHQTNPEQFDSQSLLSNCALNDFNLSSGQMIQGNPVVNDGRNLDPPTSNFKIVNRKVGTGRPKFYKVESTPEVSEDGRRHCFYCSGQVRPQMCGGNKHRWRCVDKRCRKWYGWVRSHEEIPQDLGKKGRWKDLVKIRRKTPSLSDEDRKVLEEYAMKSGASCSRLLNKTRTRSLIEKKAHWWANDRRQHVDNTPPNEWGVDTIDAAVATRVLAKSMSTAANIRIDVDDPYALAATLDILMDTLFSSFGPLFSILSAAPSISVDQETLKRIWESSAEHTPIL